MEHKGYTLQQAVDHVGEAFAGLSCPSPSKFPSFWTRDRSCCEQVHRCYGDVDGGIPGLELCKQEVFWTDERGNQENEDSEVVPQES